MSRATLLGLVLALGAAIGLYLLKDQVQRAERELRAVRLAIQHEHGQLERLRAEWAILARPARVAALAEAHLDLRPARPVDIMTIDQIPHRDEVLLSGRRWLATLPSGAAAELRLKPSAGLERLADGRRPLP